MLLLSVRKQQQAYVGFDVGHDLSLAAFSYWKKVFVCKFGIAVLYLVILMYSWEFPAERLPCTRECRSATMDLPAHLCQWRIISFFDEFYILWFTSTIPSLKVILVSISSPLPSWRYDTFLGMSHQSLDRLSIGISKSNVKGCSWKRRACYGFAITQPNMFFPVALSSARTTSCHSKYSMWQIRDRTVPGIFFSPKCKT